jgi:endonuclease/exonuclease/phosphatase family metal-dependent hydrolase
MRDHHTNTEFLMMNTHFDHIGKEARRNSAVLLKQKASGLGQHLPVIITGDFNCTRQEAAFSVMIDQEDIALIDSSPGDPAGTFCGFKTGGMPCIGIDYIFHTPQWDALEYKVIGDNDGRYYPSDHLPVFTKLKITKP